ncbi:MAG: type IV fimbrial biogenesis protein FimT [Glaciecola sp.]|jgi:type IV fimbrial biogenesis protein FimT
MQKLENKKRDRECQCYSRLQNNRSNAYTKSEGTTLVEVMVVVGILAILGGLGVPGLLSIISKARITAETNHINSLIRFARFTAIDQEQPAVLCPARDYSVCESDWSSPKIVFIDRNNNNERDPQEPMLMSLHETTKSTVVYSRNKLIRFYESGITASPASVRICPESQDEHYARLLTVSLQGKVKLSSDRDDDGVHENNSGVPLTCS